MLKGLLASTALVSFAVFAASTQAATLHEGRSTYLHSHHHAAHHYHMTNGRHDAVKASESYGAGSHPPRTTATGGNPGGYSTRN